MKLDQYPIGKETLIPACDLKSLAINNSISPLFYWESRSNEETILAIGIHKKVKINDTHEETVIGATRFEKGACAKEWEAFGDNFFFIPKVLLRKRRDKYSVTIYDQIDNLFTTQTERKYCSPFATKEIPTEDRFLTRFNESLSEMKRDDVKKIVLAKKVVHTFDKKINEWDIFDRSYVKKYNYSLLFRVDPNHTFISFSPEQLFKIKNGKIQCDSMAGTIRKDEHNTILTKSKKALNEQQIVTDGLINKLSLFCKDITSKSPAVIEVSNHLKHLYTQVSGTPKKSLSAVDAINYLHPTPAVGGMPWDKAKTIINKNEQFDRGLYAAPCGIIEKNNIEFLVGIRSALVENKNLHLFAGAGITECSQGEQEWEEMENKMKQFSLQI